MKNILKQIVIVISLCNLSLINTAIGGDLDADFDIDTRGSDCISIRTIRDYTALDDRSLLIWASAKRPYFVRLSTPSWGLKTSFQLGTVSRDDRLCPYGGDALVFGFAGRDTARIASIRQDGGDSRQLVGGPWSRPGAALGGYVRLGGHCLPPGFVSRTGRLPFTRALCRFLERVDSKSRPPDRHRLRMRSRMAADL